MKATNYLKPVKYNNESIINHVRNLNYGRAAGTIGEKNALNYIKTQLQKNNARMDIEPFDYFSCFTIYRRFSQYIFFGVLALISLSFLRIIINELDNLLPVRMQLYFNMFTASQCFLVLGFLPYIFMKYFYICYRVIRKFDKQINFAKKDQSHNIITRIESINSIKGPKTVVILSAHYDSISTNYRIKYFFLQIILILIFGSCYFFMELTPFQQVVFGCFLIGMISTLFLFKSRNTSHGSIDNGSGVSILIELSRIFGNRPLENVEIIFLWTGAEEMGLWGARQFCYNHFKDLSENYDLDHSYYINIDMVGTQLGITNKNGPLRKKHENNIIIDEIIDIAKEKGLSLAQHKNNILYSSDNKVFDYFSKKYNINLLSCCFSSKKDIKYVHSPRDSLDKCSKRQLNNCLEICYHLMKRLDIESIFSL